MTLDIESRTLSAAAPSPRARRDASGLSRALAALGSLRLTVPLFAMAIFLTLAGTLAQIDKGLWTVLSEYFRTFVAWIDVQIFFPRSYSIPGRFPFPGGWLIGGALFVNLVAAHGRRFKVKSHGSRRALGVVIAGVGAVLVLLMCIDRLGVQPGGLSQISLGWGILLGVVLVLLAGGVLLFEERAGIVVAHAGLMTLLLSELITGLFAVEGQMVIVKDGSSSFTEQIREPELAVIDRSDPKEDVEVTVPTRFLKEGAVIRHAALPFDVEVVQFMKNSTLERAGPSLSNRATAGTGLEAIARPETETSGTESSEDEAAAYLTLREKGSGEPLGTWLVSYRFYSQFAGLDVPQHVTVGDKTYDMYLRFGRTWQPYTITLKEFRHDLYPGTTVPKDFSSFVRLQDPERGVDREVRIWMNHPLRHHGQTFYQQSFLKNDAGTVLQVVNNPGWGVPYISCLMVGAGLIFHFLGVLRRFLARKRESGVTRTVGRFDRFAPWLAVLLFASFVGRDFMPRTDPPGAMAVAEFAKLPVTHGGRVKPLDSIARETLLEFGDRQSVTDESDPSKRVSRPAIDFLLDVMVVRDSSFDRKVFRIDNDQLRSMLGLPERDGLRYALSEFNTKAEEIAKQATLARKKRSSEHDPFDLAVMELDQNLTTWVALVSGDMPQIAPPEHAGENWRSLSQFEPTNAPESARQFAAILDAYHNNDPAAFNAAVAAYRTELQRLVPGDVTKGKVETFYNHFGAFDLDRCTALYLLAFVLCIASWLGWSSMFNRAAYWLVALTLVIHAAGLVTRIYLSGRPPVTNLYSSALFIGWGGVLLALVIEWFTPTGVATLIASLIGSGTLLVAFGLGGTGDTMEVLQAVLDTKFWLATHVVCVTLGYATTYLAGLFGIVTIIRGVATKSLDAPMFRSLGRMTYGVLCFATLLSFVGTVLGGIWADQSWGRFWGWDPKENGALMIVLWNALILHARWAGMIRERGVAALAVCGNIVTSWSWMGVNMLGVGLHSYGFTDNAKLYTLLGFVASQLILVAVATLPLEKWRSPLVAGT